MVTYTTPWFIPFLKRMERSRYLFAIIIYPLMNHLIPLVVPSLQEFFLAMEGGDNN